MMFLFSFRPQVRIVNIKAKPGRFFNKNTL